MRHTLCLVALLLAGPLHAEDAVPQGYELQVLEPLGGKILRPKGWFYSEGHRARTWMWTLSKEDTHDGKNAYDTGVRIQAFAGVREATGKSPEAFLKGFLAQKKSAASKVHKECRAADQGLFTRTCLEISEGENRILYSVFWSNDIDMAVISIAGAKTADWQANAKFFDAMSAFELIDLSRFPSEGSSKGGARPSAPRSKSGTNGGDKPQAGPQGQAR